MARETITLTRDLFDELLQAAADKERNRILNLFHDCDKQSTHHQNAACDCSAVQRIKGNQ